MRLLQRDAGSLSAIRLPRKVETIKILVNLIENKGQLTSRYGKIGLFTDV